MESILKIELDYDLLAEKTAERLFSRIPAQGDKRTPKREKLRGIRGLASYLGIGVNKAQNLKNAEAIPYYENGGLLFFFSDEVDAALRKGGEK